MSSDETAAVTAAGQRVGIRGFTGWLGVVLGSPDPVALARFYRDLLGWSITADERGEEPDPTWVTMGMRDPEGKVTFSNLAFQYEEIYQRPVWPNASGEQQMQFHLDIAVTNVDEAVEDALALGASLAEFQPQDDVRVLRDPDGHPFCLYLDA